MTSQFRSLLVAATGLAFVCLPLRASQYTYNFRAQIIDITGTAPSEWSSQVADQDYFRFILTGCLSFDVTADPEKPQLIARSASLTVDGQAGLRESINSELYATSNLDLWWGCWRIGGYEFRFGNSSVEPPADTSLSGFLAMPALFGDLFVYGTHNGAEWVAYTDVGLSFTRVYETPDVGATGSMLGIAIATLFLVGRRLSKPIG